MHRDDVDAVRRLLVAVEQDHPRPRTEYEPSRSPPTTQFNTSERERLQRSQRTGDSSPSVVRQVEGRDCLVHILPGLRGDDYLRHSGQLVERRPFAASRLRQTLLGTLPGTGYRIEDLDDPGGVWVCIVECRGEK